MVGVYVVVCPVCKTQNITDEPGAEEYDGPGSEAFFESLNGASIQCTQCGETISAYGGKVKDFRKPIENKEPDLFGFADM